MQILIPSIIAIAFVSFLAGCGGRRDAVSSTPLDRIETCDSLPKAVKDLVRAVADGDSMKFASLVSYPLQRPYPLRDIQNDSDMMTYYRRLVDDSLKSEIIGSGPEFWQNYGWRGMALKDGQFLWVDDFVYDVPYLSKQEIADRDSLIADEMNSLDASLRGWRPETCLRSEEDGSVFRIDSRKDKRGILLYRMAIYASGADLHAKPQQVMTGHKQVEGTAGTVTYNFIGRDGGQVIYAADVPDGSQPQVIYLAPDSTETAVPVARAYWRDLLGR